MQAEYKINNTQPVIKEHLIVCTMAFLHYLIDKTKALLVSVELETMKPKPRTKRKLHHKRKEISQCG